MGQWTISSSDARLLFREILHVNDADFTLLLLSSQDVELMSCCPLLINGVCFISLLFIIQNGQKMDLFEH